MKKLSVLLSFGMVVSIAITPVWADETPAMVSLPYPAMTGPLVANPNPFDIDAGPLGKIYFTGVISGLGLLQDNPVLGNPDSLVDLSNVQLFVQKNEGLFQFYIQTGGYSLPALGASYIRMNNTTNDFYGVVPVGFIKLAANDKFSIMAGKLPTLIGSENAFTFQNYNIERGLLWNQTNAINRGVQMNVSQGPFTGSVALSDGFYSGKLNWLSALITATINPHSSVTVVASGNIRHDSQSSLVTPLAQNNSQIYDLIYSYTLGQWTISPSLQYTHVPQDANIGLLSSTSTYGAALVTKYTFDAHWSLAGRAEYIDTSGGTNVAYGPGSNAWSLTVTPTYQYHAFFARGEASLVRANNITAGSGFGPNGTDQSQGRLLIETGVLF